MPVQIEQAVRYQLCPGEAGAFTLHASIVHLAGVVADHEALDSSGSHEGLSFDPHAITATQFVQTDLPALLAEVRAQLQDTLTLIYPHAMAA
jgi:hypothetical protein